MDRLLNYVGLDGNIVNLELVDSIINKLDKGKSTGGAVSGTFAELSPCCYSMISKLFKAMIDVHYVPDAFGLGLNIPIPKCNS